MLTWSNVGIKIELFLASSERKLISFLSNSSSIVRKNINLQPEIAKKNQFLGGDIDFDMH